MTRNQYFQIDDLIPPNLNDTASFFRRLTLDGPSWYMYLHSTTLFQILQVACVLLAVFTVLTCLAGPDLLIFDVSVNNNTNMSCRSIILSTGPRISTHSITLPRITTSSANNNLPASTSSLGLTLSHNC
ncbi:hypothetical protein N656DRAFT_796901 [Canariomyces notabilis]|uniref:Uncharacterized protein n=1 Tax=Canariomyces notabilis TaxID=2074819 RepID=A0AAN6YUM6_9PEZI|nr:hypothetical protein N656DRAFT_796901 [Canariomyces arenarius]